MGVPAYSEANLPDLLPTYYSRLFPHQLFHRWLCYDTPKNFNRREISFTLHGDIYLRYQTFNSHEEFASTLRKRFPIKIDIGAVYKDDLKGGHCRVKIPAERELVFDIDMTDYDEVRTCCSGADVCSKCWTFMNIACEIIDAALREDFGFQHILWVFSGRRGVHCWVADKHVRRFDDNIRASIAEYLQVISGSGSKRVRLPSSNIHHSLQRALKVIDEYFESAILVDQDILGTDERLAQFLGNVDEESRSYFSDAMAEKSTTRERWSTFLNTFNRLWREQKLPKTSKNLVEEIKLYYSYPRLDINVTKGMNHLLKAPFCVHPKTGKISVPFKPKSLKNFDLDKVPTISQVMAEVDDFDAKTKEMEQLPEGQSPSSAKIKDYKKTSLLKYVTIFNEFLRGLETAAAKGKANNSELF